VLLSGKAGRAAPSKRQAVGLLEWWVAARPHGRTGGGGTVAVARWRGRGHGQKGTETAKRARPKGRGGGGTVVAASWIALARLAVRRGSSRSRIAPWLPQR